MKGLVMCGVRTALVMGILGGATFFSIRGQENEPAKKVGQGPQIQFEKTEHDFGTLNQGDPAIYEFVFKNVGDEPLIITSAVGSCGCTVPSYSKEPVPPGGTGKIQVKYDSQRIGPINKTVTVTSNATNQPTVTLRIKGEVKAVDKEAMTPQQPTPLVPTQKK